MSTRKCMKCGHVAPSENGEPQACPACGAIYLKVEEALRAASDSRPGSRNEDLSQPARHSQAMRQSSETRFQRSRKVDGDEDVDVHDFAKRMRAESLYPTWRQLVVIYKWLGYAIALFIFGAGIVMLFTKGAGFSTFPLIGGVITAIVVKAMVELSLMMADMSDASVRMAAQREQQ